MQHHHEGDNRERADKGGRLDLVAEPLDRDRAGAIGEPGEAESRRDDAEDEEENADHRV